MIERISRETASKMAEKLNLPAGPLSYSQIDSFMKCQRAYYFRYIAKEPQPFSLVMSMGDALHKGLETIHRELLVSKSKERTSRSLAKYLDLGLRTSRSSIDLILKNEAVKSEGVSTIKKQGQCIEDLLKLWTTDRLPEVDIVGAEEKFYIVVAGAPMTVRIDLLRKKRVSDFKLTKRKKSDKDVANSLQLSVYCLATELDEASFISFSYPNPDKLLRWTPTIEEVTTNKNPGDKKWAEEIIGGVSKTLSTKPRTKEYFHPCNPADWACSSDYCDWWNVCRGKSKAKTPSWLESPPKKRTKKL